MTQLSSGFERSAFSALDRHFAGFLTQLSGAKSNDLSLAAALVSHYTQNGHVCLDLNSVAGKAVALGSEGSGSLHCPDLESWTEGLRKSSVVGAPGSFCPLILDEANRLYLCRYWQYENQLAEFLLSRGTRQCEGLDLGTLKGGLARMFPENGTGTIDWQKIAALAAVHRMFCVISGGPGTGKTSTVVKILVLLLEQPGGDGLRIALAAPTGKAAARLKEAVTFAKQRLDCNDEIRALIPEDAFTLHRLLGSIPHSTRFRHTKETPLLYDVVVVDEASMVDLPLMAKLVDALPEKTRLILLGDKDQLASVEPGAVFGEICGGINVNQFSPQFCQLALEVGGGVLPQHSEAVQKPGLRDSIVVLDKSYRFGADSGIGKLSQLITSGQGQQAMELLLEGSCKDIVWRDVPPPPLLETALEKLVLGEYCSYVKSITVEEAFAAIGHFRVLSALRAGPFGVHALNGALEQVLVRRGIIHRAGRWYCRQPLMVTQNDYHLGLYNGDIGIVFPDPGAGNEEAAVLRAFFPAEGGGFRKLLPMRLPAHETVYAMTVHKGQGSEFDRVLLVLPDRSSEVLTRGLLYTAITRARQSLEIWGARPVFEQAVARRIERNSGLRQALWVG